MNNFNVSSPLLMSKCILSPYNTNQRMEATDVKNDPLGQKEQGQAQTRTPPPYGKIYRFDHIHLWVGNAYQAANFYSTNFGFEYYAYKGLLSGERKVATHVLKNGEGTYLAFSSVYNDDSNKEMNEHLITHGDGVKDVALEVENSQALFEYAVKNGGIPVTEPHTLEDEHGKVIISQVKTYGDTIHSFIQRNGYKGTFLPGFKPHHLKNPINSLLPPVVFNKIDHVVGNQPDLQMEEATRYYEKTFGWHRFWTVDDSIIHTEYSSLRSIVVADYDENVKMPINEPANGKRKSQIQEYVDYYQGAGVQHIALNTSDVIGTVESMKARGAEFLSIPDNYYDNLRKNLSKLDYKISEDVDLLQKNKILVDYDDKGYLLQIFTKPVEDRPTLFYEVIQRHGHDGFGAGNFKSLFESIQYEQQKRGNLTEFKRAKY